MNTPRRRTILAAAVGGLAVAGAAAALIVANPPAPEPVADTLIADTLAATKAYADETGGLVGINITVLNTQLPNLEFVIGPVDHTYPNAAKMVAINLVDDTLVTFAAETRNDSGTITCATGSYHAKTGVRWASSTGDNTVCVAPGQPVDAN